MELKKNELKNGENGSKSRKQRYLDGRLIERVKIKSSQEKVLEEICANE